jgi:hypothetical protein
MSSTGYKAIVFTEINPTSTTTTIEHRYNKGWDPQGFGYTLSPFIVLRHDTPITRGRVLKRRSELRNAVFHPIECNMLSPNIPTRITLPSSDIVVHFLFNEQAADWLVEVGLGTDVVRLGPGGFVIVRPGELAVLCETVGIAEES